MLSKRISKLLQLKEYTKDICEAELKKALSSLDMEKKRLLSIEKEIEETIKRYDKCQQEGLFNIQDLEFLIDYLFSLNEKAKKQKRVIDRLAIDVQKKTEKLLEAHKEKQMVEIMYDKLIKEENKSSEKHEQKEQDLNFLYNKSRL
ncbi:MAG: flagellar export protein FliJ [Thermodesulfovibrionales bacterium]|nr:flagellar export protein FliJ [Thermodesulfovibrionales bacterium]